MCSENLADDGFIIPIDGELDLHQFNPRDAIPVVESYLEACRREGIFHIRIITGKGKGVQKALVLKKLNQLPGIEEIHEAPPFSGGWGALEIVLTQPE